MSSDTTILEAFKRFVATCSGGDANCPSGNIDEFSRYFLGLPWDEKVFKIGLGGSDCSSGTWMARVCKAGPSLELTPTTDPGRKALLVRGHAFWKHLSLAVEPERRRTELSALAGRARMKAVNASEFFLNRWDKRSFLKWTAVPAGEPRKVTAPVKPGRAPSKSYVTFYQ